MSDIATKPAEESPASPVTAPESQPAAEAAVPETKTEVTPAAASTETPAETTTPAATKEEAKKEGESKVEATPASEGVLGFKHPPFPSNMLFSKRFFWFNDEPVKSENLSAYLKETKAEVAHPTASWAQESGKGLLFYAKRAEDKSHPAGILNLADASDVTKEGVKDFFFKINGHKYVFAADNAEQQASWIVALEKKIQEAKDNKETITNSEGYKSNLDKHSKPAAIAGPAAAAAATAGKAEAKTKKTTKKDKSDASSSSSSSDDDKKGKSRSVSRKRGSIFGALLGKKEETKKEEEKKTEEKKVEKEEATEAKPAGESSTAAEPAAAVAAVPAVESATPAAPVETAEEKKTEETPAVAAAEPTKETPAATERPTDIKKAKRNSVFGNFFQKVTSPTTEKSEKEVAPEVPAKDAGVSDTAPKVDTPVEQQPIDTAAVTAPVDKVDTPAAETPKETKETPAAAPKESKFKGFLKKAEKKTESSTPTKKEEDKKPEETPAHTAATEAPAAPAATETPATETTPKDKRRTSIFGQISGTIKKKTAGAKGTKTPSEEKKEPIAETAASDAKPEPISKEEPKEPLTNGTTTDTAAPVSTEPTAEAPKATPQVSATA